jgi:hypothetical protein
MESAESPLLGAELANNGGQEHLGLPQSGDSALLAASGCVTAVQKALALVDGWSYESAKPLRLTQPPVKQPKRL